MLHWWTLAEVKCKIKIQKFFAVLQPTIFWSWSLGQSRPKGKKKKKKNVKIFLYLYQTNKFWEPRNGGKKCFCCCFSHSDGLLKSWPKFIKHSTYSCKSAGYKEIAWTTFTKLLRGIITIEVFPKLMTLVMCLFGSILYPVPEIII